MIDNLATWATPRFHTLFLHFLNKKSYKLINQYQNSVIELLKIEYATLCFCICSV